MPYLTCQLDPFPHAHPVHFSVYKDPPGAVDAKTKSCGQIWRVVLHPLLERWQSRLDIVAHEGDAEAIAGVVYRKSFLAKLPIDERDRMAGARKAKSVASDRDWVGVADDVGEDGGADFEGQFEQMEGCMSNLPLVSQRPEWIQRILQTLFVRNVSSMVDEDTSRSPA